MPRRQLELDDNTGGYSRVILSATEDGGVDPISLKNAPVKRPEDFRVYAASDRDRKGVIRNAGDPGNRRTRVYPSKQDMSKRRNTRRPRHLGPEQIVSRGGVGSVVTRKIGDGA